jgi:16S rRNA (guanine527-N7)-methyltransferase
MLQHERLLQSWNPRINLTRIVEPREVARRHFGEALFLNREANLSGSVADLGAGAGFPGLPIAAVDGEIQMLEVESVMKKATFMREVSRDWGNVRVSETRIEDLRGPFDWVIMRAVAVEPLVKRLAELAPRAALLAGSRSFEALERDGIWKVRRRIPLPWDGPGELLIAERSGF